MDTQTMQSYTPFFCGLHSDKGGWYNYERLNISLGMLSHLEKRSGLLFVRSNYCYLSTQRKQASFCFFNPFCLPCSAASNLFRIDNKLFYQKKGGWYNYERHNICLSMLSHLEKKGGFVLINRNQILEFQAQCHQKEGEFENVFCMF